MRILRNTGTIVDPEMLRSSEDASILLAVAVDGERIGICAIDAATSRIGTLEVSELPECFYFTEKKRRSCFE